MASIYQSDPSSEAMRDIKADLQQEAWETGYDDAVNGRRYRPGRDVGRHQAYSRGWSAGKADMVE